MPVKILRKTPTSTSVRFAAEPQAAKQVTRSTKGTTRAGYTSLGLPSARRPSWTSGRSESVVVMAHHFSSRIR